MAYGPWAIDHPPYAISLKPSAIDSVTPAATVAVIVGVGGRGDVLPCGFLSPHIARRDDDGADARFRDRGQPARSVLRVLLLRVHPDADPYGRVRRLVGRAAFADRGRARRCG